MKHFRVSGILLVFILTVFTMLTLFQCTFFQTWEFKIPKMLSTTPPVECQVGWCPSTAYPMNMEEAYKPIHCNAPLRISITPLSKMRTTNDYNNCMGLNIIDSDPDKQDNLYWVKYTPCNPVATEYQVFLDYPLGMAILQGSEASGFQQLTCFEQPNANVTDGWEFIDHPEDPLLTDTRVAVFKGILDTTQGDVYFVFESSPNAAHVVRIEVKEVFEDVGHYCEYPEALEFVNGISLPVQMESDKKDGSDKAYPTCFQGTTADKLAAYHWYGYQLGADNDICQIQLDQPVPLAIFSSCDWLSGNQIACTENGADNPLMVELNKNQNISFAIGIQITSEQREIRAMNVTVTEGICETSRSESFEKADVVEWDFAIKNLDQVSLDPNNCKYQRKAFTRDNTPPPTDTGSGLANDNLLEFPCALCNGPTMGWTVTSPRLVEFADFKGARIKFWVYHDDELSEVQDLIQVQYLISENDIEGNWMDIGEPIMRYDGFGKGWRPSIVNLTPLVGRSKDPAKAPKVRLKIIPQNGSYIFLDEIHLDKCFDVNTAQ